MNYWEPEGYHTLGKGHYAGVTTDAVFRRMLAVTGLQTPEGLASWLDCPIGVLREAEQRNIMPIRWVRRIVMEYADCNPVWLMTGQGERTW